MPLRPMSPRLGEARKQQTQQEIEEMLRQATLRRSQLSRFSRSGAPRNPRSMSPIRGAGIRAFSGGFPNRLGAASPSLQPRGPGFDPSARMPFEDLPGGPGNPGRGGPPIRRDPPVRPPQRLAGGGYLPDAPEFQGGDQPFLGGAGNLPSYDPGDFMGQTSPSSPIFNTNLIPLGGGAWLDLTTGQIRGAGGGGFKAM